MLFKKTLFAVAVLAFSGTCAAASVTTAFEVKMKVIDGCNFVTGAPPAEVRLGHQDGVSIGSTAESNQTTITIKCTAGATYSIGLTPRNVPSTTGAGVMRRMGGGSGEDIAYQLRVDSISGNPWGSIGTDNSSGQVNQGVRNTMPNATSINHVVHISSTNNTAAQAGDYSDFVDVLVHY